MCVCDIIGNMLFDIQLAAVTFVRHRPQWPLLGSQRDRGIHHLKPFDGCDPGNNPSTFRPPEPCKDEAEAATGVTPPLLVPVLDVQRGGVPSAIAYPPATAQTSHQLHPIRASPQSPVSRSDSPNAYSSPPPACEIVSCCDAPPALPAPFVHVCPPAARLQLHSTSRTPTILALCVPATG